MITLVLGGARSGKSRFAEALVSARGAPVTYLATARVGDDPGFAARVAAHRARRPAAWRTVEAGAALIEGVAAAPADHALLVDSLGTWVAACEGFATDGPGLCAALAARRSAVVIVSEEVGLGVHPSTDVGGRFRDVLGALNDTVSRRADEAWLVVAGRPLRLPAHWEAAGEPRP